ncbi:MAG: 50S ribosomal protein L24 [Candidatus Omnitrophota bacterium]
MSLRIKKGDKVAIIAGRDKGKAGKVLKVLLDKMRVVVEGTNLVKKHIRRRSENESGGIREIPASINLSNVSLFCSNCDRGVKFEVKISKDKTKARICKKCSRVI